MEIAFLKLIFKNIFYTFYKSIFHEVEKFKSIFHEIEKFKSIFHEIENFKLLIDCSETVRIEYLDTTDFYEFCSIERNYFI